MVDWHGIASQTQYIKDVAAKFGVHFTVVKVGKYKSFTEKYTEDKMSDANREQVTRYINGLWQTDAYRCQQEPWHQQGFA